MVNINYAELHFDHLVAFQEGAIFACARENGSGKSRLFLIFGNGNGRVYTRNGRVESWEILGGQKANNIRQRIKQATKDGVAVYRFNGSSKIVHPNLALA